METSLTIADFRKEIDLFLDDEATVKNVLAIPFKGLTLPLAKSAMLEGRMRGFSFQDFLQKNLYALPFKNKTTGVLTYSLVTSIDYARKVGMRSGVVGKSAPKYTENDKGQIVSCEITVKRKIEEYIGDFTATVYFAEYNTGYQQWAAKPRTMIAKVAEMHALRMACPEELSQAYTEEEYDQETTKQEIREVQDTKKLDEAKTKLEECKTLDELKKIWSNLSGQEKLSLESIKNSVKEKLSAVDGVILNQ